MLTSQRKLYQLLFACMLGVSTSAFAATDSDDATAYVDSVYEWGAWELGIEPAAGGPTPSPSRVISARDSNVTFRPNENSAVSPVVRSIPITKPVSTGQPLPTGVPNIGGFR